MSSSKGVDEFTRFKEKYPEATEEDFNSYKVNKRKWFKGTIVVCVVYGFFALALLLITIFVSAARTFLAEHFRAFVVTLVGGMIFIIIMLIVQILSFKPKVFSRKAYDSDMCPDYWRLEKVPDAEIAAKGSYVSEQEKFLMSYRCVPQERVYNMAAKYYSDDPAKAAQINDYQVSPDDMGKPRVYVNLDGTPTDKQATSRFYSGTDAFKKNLGWKMAPSGVPKGNTAATASEINGFNKLYCDQVYPKLLASIEQNDKDLKSYPNLLRCAYAKKCGIPWTAVCPNKENLPAGSPDY